MRPGERVKTARRARGVSMIEVLVAILILTIGLLGVAGLQMHMQTAQLEAYQRSHAIMLLQDMVDRINANRKQAADYVTSAPLGTANTTACSSTTTIALKDKCEWSNQLLGAAEVVGSDKVGAMIGARGCITLPVASMPRQAIVAVVWQGITPTLAAAATTCGQNEYGDEKTRRALVASVTIGCLENNVTTGVCITP
ncbi:MAG: type IV pilus modification protein PilV [Pseudomonadota bacterium]